MHRCLRSFLETCEVEIIIDQDMFDVMLVNKATGLGDLETKYSKQYDVAQVFLFTFLSSMNSLNCR